MPSNRGKSHSNLFGVTGTLVAMIVSTASAATLRVGSDETYTTISAAISAADEGDTIEVVDAVHTEAASFINKTLVITGQNGSTTIVQAAPARGTAAHNVFIVGVGKTVTFRNLTIRHGKVLLGGGIYCDVGSDVTVDRCVLSHNDATANGGGLYSNAGANLTLIDTTVTDNATTGLGGGIMLSAVANSQVNRCLISQNRAGLDGGGLYCIGDATGVNTSIVNTTISQNTANAFGGGVYIVTTSAVQALSVTLNAVTIVDNHCNQDDGLVGEGGGLATALVAGSVTVTNSIIANNFRGNDLPASDDISGQIISRDYNLFENIAGTTITGVTTHNIAGQDPNLSSPGHYGGPTLSYLLLPGSPAIDHIPSGTNDIGTSPLDVDQRGVTRPYGIAGDVGAVETGITLTTTAVSHVTAESADSGGHILTNGGESITTRGVCWNFVGGPTASDTCTTDGSGRGTFTSNLSDLSPNTAYYVRAYATNSVGTTHGQERTFTTLTVTPTVAVNNASSITTTTASSGGNVTDDGGAEVTTRGACWNTTGSPTIGDTCTTDGAGTGSFASSLTGLSAGTKYYVRAYAANSAGTRYSSETSFKTLAAVPAVTEPNISGTTEVSSEASSGVISNGGATVTARGVCWSTASNPTTSDMCTSDGMGTGNFTSSLTGLSANTTYYVRAYATNSAGTAYSGSISFTTPGSEPSMTTATVTAEAITSISATAASGGGNVIKDGGAAITARGVCWNTTGGPTTSDTCTTDGAETGSFDSDLIDLSRSTTYYLRAYAINSAGTAYSSELTFTTSATTPTLAAPDVATVTTTSAQIGGDIVDDGGDVVITRGVCWNTTGNPTTGDTCTSDGSGDGSFTSHVSDLSPGTTYYVRTYAANSAGTEYSSHAFFTTSTTTPTVEEPSISTVLDTSASASGNILDDGGSAVTARGVCWNTTGRPTTSDACTNDGAGIGSFSSSLAGLSGGTTYYVVTYATNEAGTSYSSEVIFTTLGSEPKATTPTVTVEDVSSIASSSASGGGTVIDNGGDPVTARGLCWSTSENPTTEDTCTTDGSGMNSFTSSLTELSPYTLYYARAYATNSAGTAYSSQTSFKTAAEPPTVTGSDVTSISTTSASSGGEVVSNGGATVTVRGVCWSTTTNPTTGNICTNDGSGIGEFASSLDGLTPATTYYVRAYAINSAGTTHSQEFSFTTPTAKPTVSAPGISDIADTSAQASSNVGSDGGAEISAHGVCWNTTGNPTTSDTCTMDGAGTGGFVSDLSDLSPDTTYYVVTYATNSAGTAYSSLASFTTASAVSLPPPGSPDSPPPVTTPTVTVSSISSITAISASSGGKVADDGGGPVTAYGICWNTTGNPTLDDTCITEGAGTGGFTSSLERLSPGTPYYVVGFATNSAGTSYSSEGSFTTLATLPNIELINISNIAGTSASADSMIDHNGGTLVTARGVCWNTTGNPTTDEICTSDGSGIGDFTSDLIELLPGTTYYVQAYAISAIGTAYSSQVSFTTAAALVTLPTVTISSVSSTSTTSATSGGNVSANGGAAVTRRGVCWNTTGNPTTSDTCTADGSGLDSFISNLTGMTPETTYYVRAYATNAVGTAYSDDIYFTTVARGKPDLNITVNPRETSYLVGDKIPFDIDLHNAGDGHARNVRVTLPLPDHTEFVSTQLLSTPTSAQVSPPQVDATGNQVVLTFDTIPPNERTRIELVLRPIDAKPITLSASAIDGVMSTQAEHQADVEVHVEHRVVRIESPGGLCGAGFGLAWIGIAMLIPAMTLGQKRRFELLW